MSDPRDIKAMNEPQIKPLDSDKLLWGSKYNELVSFLNRYDAYLTETKMGKELNLILKRHKEL